MPRILAILALAGALPLFAAIPDPREPAAVGSWFAETLRSGDARALDALLAPGATVRSWRELQAVFARNGCISAEASSARSEWPSSNVAIVRVQVRATGISNAASHAPRDLPSMWRLELRQQPEGSWRLASAMTVERETALCMVGAESTAEAERIYATTPGIDPLATLQAYAYEASEGEPLPRAAVLFPHAVALARESGDARTLTDVLQLQSSTYAMTGAPGALAIAQEALAVARTTGDAYDLSGGFFNLGVIHLLERREAESLEPLHQAAALIDRSSDPVLSLKALRMHIWILERLGRTLDVVRETDQFAELSRRYQWLEGEEVAAFQRASVLQTLGNLDGAAESLASAAELARAAGNSEHIGLAYHDMAFVHAQQGRLDAALEAARRAVQSWPFESPERIRIQAQLAELQIEKGDRAGAEATLRSAEKTLHALPFVPAAAGVLLNTRSRLLLTTDRPAEALAAARKAVEALQGLEAPEERQFYGDALTATGRALRALGRRTEAIETFRAAVDLIESERRHAPDLDQARIVFLQNQLAPYFELTEMLAERADTAAAALHVAEQMKARALLEASARSGGDLSGELSEDERKREGELEGRVAELNRALYRRRSSRAPGETQLAALDDARMELAQFRSELRLKYPRVAARDVVIPDKLPLADRDVVEFVVGETGTLAFLVPAAGSGRAVRAIPIAAGRSALTRRVDRYVHALEHRSFAYRPDARALYETLLQPLGAFAKAGTDLCIIPDGPLWRLPFHTLIAPSGKHVAQQRAVSYAPSLAILHADRPRHGDAATLLALGNPRVSGTQRQTVRMATTRDVAGPLPEAEEEVRSIVTLYRDAMLFTGDGATESAFKREAPKHRILHLATHGFVVTGAPLYSSLLLSDDGVNDGVLEAREVAELQLDADLAVLSACDTASGQISAGEGVVGLAWAFLAAGCPTTVVSQWSADSAATAKLMVEFHRRLREGRTPAVALRMAQMTLMRSPAYWHPYYWAPFVVLGKDGAVSVRH